MRQGIFWSEFKFDENLFQLLTGLVTFFFRYIVHQFAKVLPNNAEARRAFVSSGGLKKVQEIQAEPGSKLKEWVLHFFLQEMVDIADTSCAGT